MVGYSVARYVNYYKCMENYQFFRRVKSFGGMCLRRYYVCIGYFKKYSDTENREELKLVFSNSCIALKILP